VGVRQILSEVLDDGFLEHIGIDSGIGKQQTGTVGSDLADGRDDVDPGAVGEVVLRDETVDIGRVCRLEEFAGLGQRATTAGVEPRLGERPVSARGRPRPGRCR